MGKGGGGGGGGWQSDWKRAFVAHGPLKLALHVSLLPPSVLTSRMLNNIAVTPAVSPILSFFVLFIYFILYLRDCSIFTNVSVLDMFLILILQSSFPFFVRSSVRFYRPGRTKVQMFFKTFNPSGILMYTANFPSQSDFATCYLLAGEAVCEFSAGTGIARLKSGKSHSDGEWHKVRNKTHACDAAEIRFFAVRSLRF